ncbi:histidine kinase [Actinokineospora sp. PR83]|uniref:histidine kinase n=1 Tax=Actinokineospora sp. PR83 TaxID=2884908 RepID=UPI0027DFF1C8|nr:histidine kinase [Actinokineospora sp. PR83]MCG8920228.1 histidine kinase [Actinokineospora sp. PR83]
MIGLLLGLLRRAGGWRPRLRPPTPDAAELRRDLERVLHDGPALRTSALALELGLLAVTVTDPCQRDRVEAAQHTVRLVLDDLRQVGEALYPPVLPGAGIEPALRSVAERHGLALTLDVAAAGLGADARSRTCLLVADHLRSLRRDTAVAVRVRAGRHLVRVRITEDRPGAAPRRHWAVLRCA